MITIYSGDNLPVLKSIYDKTINLIYIDPPFNTGKKQTLNSVKSVKQSDGSSEKVKVSNMSYADEFDDFLGFVRVRLEEAKRILTDNGSIFVHLDYREVHRVKILLDEIFGQECFINEIIWAYDYGARSKKKWPTKHDNILWYAKDPENYVFNYDEIDRIPYMAPGLVGSEKAALGKTLTDCWWHTIVPTNGKERTGYPTQKPLGIIERLVKVHSNPGDVVLDYFAGSGTTGEAALKNGRSAILIDQNPEAIEVMCKRFSEYSPRLFLSEGDRICHDPLL